MIFITAEVSPIEADLFSKVLEEINVYYKYRCIILGVVQIQTNISEYKCGMLSLSLII